MGDRGNIIIEDTGVVLYTHWKGSEIPNRLANALDRSKDRWDDPAYLTRVIFQDVIGNDNSITGFGISTESTGEREYKVTVGDRRIQIGGKFGFAENSGEEFTFEEFIEEFY